MRNIGSLATLLLTLAVSVKTAGAGQGADAVRFGVCSGNISKVLVIREGGGNGPARLAITLNSAGSEQMRSFSIQIIHPMPSRFALEPPG